MTGLSLQPTAAAPDLIQPLIGFRQWKLRGDRLLSPYTGVGWDQIEMRAGCCYGGHDPDEAPTHDCSCGIYAYYDQPPRSASIGRDLVSGAVIMWGAVELHGGGMRAARARIVGLALPSVSARKRRSLIAAARYLEVPAVPFRALSRLAERHGAPAPRHWRPRRTPAPWELMFPVR